MTRTALLLIGGLDPTGQAGLARDVAVCADERIHPCTVATAVTVQTTHSFDRTGAVDAAHLEAQARAALTEHAPRWCKAGMLASQDQVDAVADLVSAHGMRLVLDPVLATSSGHQILRDGGLQRLRQLIEQADLVTPNLGEARRLTGAGDAEQAARVLVTMGARAALVTQGGRGPDVLFDGTTVHRFQTRHAVGTHRGTGCRLATRIACDLARGVPVHAAVAAAHRAQQTELQADGEEQALGERRRAHFQQLEAWLPRIMDAIRHQDVPEVGMNVAYALAGATDPRRDVLGLAGRITIAGSGVGIAGRLQYGGPHHTGRIAVVLQEYAGPDGRSQGDPVIVMNHRFRNESLENARAAGLVDRSFRREDEPADAPSSMEWGVREAIRHHGGVVPDLIWDRGGIGKEAMIRVVARSPADLVGKLEAMHGTAGAAGRAAGPPVASTARA